MDSTLTPSQQAEEGQQGLSASSLQCPGCHAAFELSAEGCAPKMLNCCHALCVKCCMLSVKTNEQNSVLCPRCSSMTPVDMKMGLKSLLNHFPIRNALKVEVTNHHQAGTLSCENCDSSAKATWKCLQCGEGISYLCESCKEQHKSLKALRSHELVSLSDIAVLREESAPSCLPSCVVHDEALDLFCHDCSQLICSTCGLFQHKDHKQLTINEGAAESKNQLTEYIGSASFAIDRVRNEVNNVRDIRDKVLSQNELLMRTVSEAFFEVQAALDKRENYVKTQFKKLSDRKLALLNDQIEALDKQLALAEESVGYAKATTTSCSSEEVIISKSLLQKMLFDMNTFSLPTVPHTLPDMVANMDQAPHVCNAISKLGSIMDETLPSPEHSSLQQQRFCLDQSGRWDVLCTFSMRTMRGEMSTKRSAVTPVVSLQKQEISTSRSEAQKDDDLDSSALSTETRQEDVVWVENTDTEGLWNIRVKCSSISVQLLSVQIFGEEVHSSPLRLRRGKPDYIFGEKSGIITAYSDLKSNFLSSVSIGLIRGIDNGAVIWNSDSSEQPSIQSHVDVSFDECNGSCSYLLSHIILKNSAAEKFKLSYRSSSTLGPSSVKTDTELKESESDEWKVFDFLTPDWTDIKPNKVLIVDITEEQCKSIGYVDAIRLEVLSAKSTNSFCGFNVYGWSGNQ